MRPAAALLLSFALASCAELQEAVSAKPLTETAPEPNTPLSVPTETMTGVKGAASAPYPSDYGVTVRSDGVIFFPQHTMGRIKGGTLLVGGDTVLTVSPSGVVKGVALKHTYHFTDTGELVDDSGGSGVRISPDGGIRAMGGSWHHTDVMTFTQDGPGHWDQHAWRTLEIVALVVIENMLPDALRDTSAASSSDAGTSKSKGLYIPPPTEWFK